MGLHTKDRISNLFSNFCKSPIMSNQHIKSWYSRKGVDWCNHLQFVAKGKKTVNLITKDHCHLVLEDVEILNSVNNSLDPTRKIFELIGRDPQCIDLKSFWWKTKCVLCNDVYNLCLPKKNLEANLRNHVEEIKDVEKLLEFVNVKKTSILLDKRGRPSKSVADSSRSQSSRKQLHAFFSHTMDNPEV